MRYTVFDREGTKYPVCILVKPLQLRQKELQVNYVDPLVNQGVPASSVLAYDLLTTGKKTPAAKQKAYLSEELLPALASLQVEWLLVCDSDYFKTLTKLTKADRHLGYIEPCAIAGYEYMKVIYCPNYAGLFYDPSLQVKIDNALATLVNGMRDTYQPPGIDIIKYADYPSTVADIKAWLDKFTAEGTDLTVDIETFGLKHYQAGIGTICFCWNKHEGIAFRVDLLRTKAEAAQVRQLLWTFFMQWQGRAIYHNISFDVYVLVYQLFMTDLLDTEGMLMGLDTMLRNWDCTKLITYLATNGCGGNKLSLKDVVQEFCGNYAESDINDITLIEPDALLQYNLVDGLGTWFALEKHWHGMVQDNQLCIYENLFKPCIKDIIQMQLTGLPLDMAEVARGKKVLEADRQSAVDRIHTTSAVTKFVLLLNEEWVAEKNETLKKKRVTLADAKETFNPGSGPQLQKLLYEVLGLPVLDYTDSKLPATGGKTLKKLVHHTQDPDVLQLLEALIDFKAVDKILNSFIPAFEAVPQAPDGWHYLHGNFNLGGTVSGRLSSNGPNLQNLPASGSKYAKVIKKMFRAPEGWLFVGLDYASLEDRISALTTRDPNKLKVYTDGFDGHCLRAQAYFADHMPDIDPASVESVNSIESLYPDWRQKSKTPTFLLTYGGTYIGLMASCGFAKDFAQMIEGRYHELYAVSDQWVAKQVQQACNDGYVTAAFGLRVRTPLLAQVVLGTSRTPYEAEAEGRTAGNALGQSWGLLNSRSAMAFMKKVRASEWKHDIRPCAQIHDAQYYLVRNNSALLEWMNRELVEEVKWQEDPLIWHDEVKLGGDLSVFHPTWADEMVIPNGSTEKEIIRLAYAHAYPEVA
ncbi:DNA polymerase [Pantoea eucrina]|uniref:DNA polymerase n=1 Tax=Pantoea eucrina TaxID=472693 RepID=UPI00080F5247|nr:DNA polymerase [Pantoea eucrina]